jgi:hypothetical protein
MAAATGKNGMTAKNVGISLRQESGIELVMYSKIDDSMSITGTPYIIFTT